MLNKQADKHKSKEESRQRDANSFLSFPLCAFDSLARPQHGRLILYTSSAGGTAALFDNSAPAVYEIQGP